MEYLEWSFFDISVNFLLSQPKINASASNIYQHWWFANQLQLLGCRSRNLSEFPPNFLWQNLQSQNLLINLSAFRSYGCNNFARDFGNQNCKLFFFQISIYHASAYFSNYLDEILHHSNPHLYHWSHASFDLSIWC